VLCNLVKQSRAGKPDTLFLKCAIFLATGKSATDASQQPWRCFGVGVVNQLDRWRTADGPMFARAIEQLQRLPAGEE
jgi:hypothetical protein